jgi:hypothetical protein
VSPSQSSAASSNDDVVMRISFGVWAQPSAWLRSRS